MLFLYFISLFALKRTLDILLSSIALLVLSPVFFFISTVLFFTIGTPVFFRQARPGKHGKIFHILKFRTMSNRKDSVGNLLPDEVRVTKLGSLLRRTSLDELPELFNVLKGDMSLVGPRPLLAEYLPLYSSFQARRHDVLPGITGWAQVNGRNSISWEKKFQLDVWYVDNHNVALDIYVLALTILKVFSFSGIDDGVGVGQSKFTGTN